MAAFTENAIKQSFLKLLEDRPYNQITVKDIVIDCGVNRNTFYYHFQDIPSLLENVVRDECDEIIRKYPSPESMEDCLMAVLEFANSHKRVIYHIYRSVDRSILETYLWKLCEYVVTTYMNTVLMDYSISKSDRVMVIRYYKCVCYGGVMDYLERGTMEEDAVYLFRRLCRIKQGEIEEFLQKIEKSQ